MKLSQLFLGGTLFYVGLSGLHCRYGVLDLLSLEAASSSPFLAAPNPDQKASTSTGTSSGTAVTAPEDLPINRYVRRAILMREQLGILYWNSSGYLEVPPLIEQCQFRNFSEAGTWPLYLQNLRIAPDQAKLALYPTSDSTEYRHYNWTFPAPIPLIAYSLPLEVANHLDRYPWIRFLPTPYELRGDGRRWVDRILNMEGTSSDKPFHQRKNQIVYRGNVVTQKYPARQRTRVMELGRDPNNQHWLNATTSPKPPMAQREQIKFKYMMDIGGISGTTWTGLRWKMCSKSLVFKVDSGFADWWHSLLRPMEHYVPVKADLSDLYEQYQWAEAHPEEAEKIAQRGVQVCHQTTNVDYLRNYTRHQIESMPAPTEAQMGQYFNLMEDSRRRLQNGKPSGLFHTTYQYGNKKRYPCPPRLTPDNI